MTSRSCVVSLFVALLVLIGDSVRTSPTSASAIPGEARITVLYDAFGRDPAMQKDWGYAALIEYGGKRICLIPETTRTFLRGTLTQKGLTSPNWISCACRTAMEITWGRMTYLLRVNPKAPIYVPKECFGVYGADLAGTSYRKDSSLAPEQRYYNGTPPERMRFGSAWPGANFQLVDKNTDIAPDIHLLTLVSDKPGTLELRELSLALNTPDGRVIVVGCSHAGIDKIVELASAINPRIHLIVGGFHLVVAPDPDIEKIVTALHDRFKVEYVAPGHCTGEPAFAALKRTFGDHYVYAGLGTTFTLNAPPRLSLGQAHGSRNSTPHAL